MDTNVIDKLNNAIILTDSSDDYSVGLRNGMRFAISCITGEEPKFEHLASNEVQNDRPE